MLGEETAGQFEIQGLLGRGGMAVVFLATENGLGRKVAIKVLPPELTFGHGLERFKREAKTSAALDHPNIIPVYRVGGSGKLFWYAMKFLEGRSLDDLLKEKGKLSLDDSLDILNQTADALDYAHERKVVHRDIKPANVMLDSRNRVIVTDFGIAKALTEGGLTASGSVIGTPYYMSPEQGMGKPVSGASDQYSVAVMAFRMLAGQVPFEGESSIDILHKHCMTPPPPISDIAPELPAHVGRALMRAMEKKAERRFTNVRQFVKALSGQPVPPAPGEIATMMMPSAAPSRVANTGKTMDRQSTELMQMSDEDVKALSRERGPKPTVTKKKSNMSVVIGAGVGVLVVAGGVGYALMTGGKPENKQPQQQVAAAPPRETTTTTAAAPPPAPTPSVTPATDNRNTARNTAPSSGRTNTQPRQQQARPQPQTTPPNPVATVPPPATAVATKGVLQLRVSPPATVSIDAVDKGVKAQFVDSLTPGTHLVHLTKDGYQPLDTAVTIKAGEPTRIVVTMKPNP